jgi:hypothetical protein
MAEMLGDCGVNIQSRDYWFKVVEMLQQNWALIDAFADSTTVCVFFFGDTGCVFDGLTFPTRREAEHALRRNGFRRYEEDIEAQNFFAKPSPSFGNNPTLMDGSIHRADLGVKQQPSTIEAWCCRI